MGKNGKRPRHQPDTFFDGELQEFTSLALSPDDPSLEPRERRRRPADKQRTTMLFSVTEDSRHVYEAFLRERADALQDCYTFLNDACMIVAQAYRAGRVGDLAVLVLGRHVVEYLDGVCLLIGKGSVLPCFPLLRSIFDAWLGAQFIMQADSDNRGAAYFVMQINQDKAFWELLDPTTNRGKELRRELKNDVMGPAAFDRFPLQEVKNRIADLDADLADPAIQAAARAFENMPKNCPEWYSIFGGRNNLRELAQSLSLISLYELYYRPWCRQIHATATLRFLSSNSESIVVPSIRRPECIHEVIRCAGKLSILLAAHLINKYAPQEQTAVLRYKELEERIDTLASVRPNLNDATASE